MKISIIVPVYNAERYLDKLVQSVLSQTYEDYELILVDDSSKDNSYSLMKKYQEMDSRIKAYTKENTGPGLTRKFGFEKSSGDLFFFVDSDDWITTSDVLREINDLFEKNQKIDVLFFDREDIIGDTKDIISGFNETREGLHNIDELNEVVRPGLGAKIFRKSILTEDMFYESTIFEDLYTTYIYLDKCSNFFYSAKCYYTIYHDIDSSSLSSKPTAESFAKSLEMILMVHEKLEKSSLRYSLELWMALLFTTYWKARVKNDTSYNSKMINDSIQKIAGILKENKIVIKPSGKKHIKVLIYKMLLMITFKLLRSRFSKLGWFVTPVSIFLIRYISLWFNLELGFPFQGELFVFWFGFYYLGVSLKNGYINLQLSKKCLTNLCLFSLVIQGVEGFIWYWMGNFDMATTQLKMSSIITTGLFCIRAYIYIEAGDLNLNEQPVILKKFLKVLGDNSFGIYLCHMLIIRILNKLVPMANVFPINAIFVIMISTVCVMMAHRILGKYAYVIGV